MAPVKKYARKNWNRCEAGHNCECVGKSDLDLLKFYRVDLRYLRRQGESCEGFRYFLDRLEPCFVRVLRRVSYDLFKGEIKLDEHVLDPKTLFELKDTLSKVCHPRIPHHLALRRLQRYAQVFPSLLCDWAHAVCDAWTVIGDLEDE